MTKRLYRYDVTARTPTETPFVVTIEAESPTGAAVIASEIAFAHKMLLIGPRHLAGERIYR